MTRALAAALLAACVCGAPPVRPIALGGWITSWSLGEGLGAVARPAPRLSDVFLFAAHLDPAGAPALPGELEQAAAVAAVRARGATPWLTVVNDRADGAGGVILKDPEIVHDVLSDPGRRRGHREAIVALARRLGVAGVDVDYERVRAEDRAHLTAFAVELAGDLRAAGLSLSVTVQPRLTDEVRDGAGAADWPALCRVADRVQIMLYNEHSAATGPGPIATVSWVDEVLRHALDQCDPGRIVAAVKVVGMEWGPDGTRDVQWSEAVALARGAGAAIERERDGDVPWFRLGAGSAARTIYFEDARSLRAKLLVARRHGVHGVVLWSLGAEDPALWSAAP